MTTDDAQIDALNGRAAGFVTRLLAYLIDALILTLVIAGGAWLFVQVDALVAEVNLWINTRISAAALWALMIPVVLIFYYVTFWSLTGQTIGKMVMGLRVISVDGNPPTIWHSLVRLIGYGISMLVFWLGYIWIIVDDQRRGWHDHMARTWVVYDFARRKRGDAYAKTIAREKDAAAS